MTELHAPPDQRISHRAGSLPYLPQLDGLRALAVTAVLLYHADSAWMSGGFLGVDLFFVLSGYLITSLLLAEWQTRGSIDLVRFWLRRARRLLPALFVVIAATLSLALVWLPDEVARLRGDALAALTYSTNWFLIFKQESYFEAMGRPSLLQHLWSLAVEEQFYLFWPPMLILLLHTFRRKGALIAALLGAIGSAVLMAVLYQPDVDPSRVYYGTDTRAFAPLLGAVLACIWPYSHKTVRPSRIAACLTDATAFAALIGLASACCLLDEYQPLLYGSGFVLVALLSAVAIAVLTHPAALLSKRVLGSAPLRWLGTRSYAIYLWHWPIFMVTRPELDVALTGWPLLVLRFGATLLMSELSYRLVESPFRSGVVGRAWQSLRTAHGVRRWQLGMQWVTTAMLALSVTVLLGVSVAEARPPAPSPDQQIEVVQDAPLPSQAADESNLLPSAPAPTASSQPLAPSATRGASASPAVAALSTRDEFLLERASDNHAAPQAPPTTTQAPPASTPVSAPTPVPVAAAPVPAVRISAIGDSVMVGTAHELHAALGAVAIDAAVSRQAKAAIAILRAQRAKGQLGDVVIVHMGTNGPFSARQFDEMMSILTNVRRVVFVTVKVPRPWEKSNNAVIESGVGRYPNTVLADWHAASAGHPELFVRDGVHPQRAGARLFASIVAAAVTAP